MRSTSEQYTCYNGSQSPPIVIAIVIAPHRLSDWLSVGINSSKCIAVYFLLLREDGPCPLEGLTCSVVRGNNRCLFCDSYETHKHTVWVNAKFVLCYSTQRPCLTSFCSSHLCLCAPCQFTLLNLRPFIFGLTFFGRFISTYLIFFFFFFTGI
jgi:hypothetical protein